MLKKDYIYTTKWDFLGIFEGIYYLPQPDPDLV